MTHAIVGAASGRRHEVDFDGADITLEIFFGDEAVEIAVEAPQDPTPLDKRRFAVLNVPRERFNKALGTVARRSKSQRPALLAEGR